jgi:hypothetical protein
MIRKIALAAALLGANPAHALDGAWLEVGGGDHGTERAGGALMWKWSRSWFADTGWELGGYWELSAGGWRTDRLVADIGFTPVFRLQRADWAGPYLEAAVGFHLLSRRSLTRERESGSNFQFGDHVGFGVRFGPRGRYDLGVRLLHLSNAGLRQPNPGINFAVLRLAYHLD